MGCLLFRLDGVLVPNEAKKIVPVIPPRAALQDRFHVFEAIELLPSFAIEILPRAVLQVRVLSDSMVRIISIEIGVHPFSAAGHEEMVTRAWQRHEHEKRCVIRTHVLHELREVSADGIDRVIWKANDVADMRRNP